MHFAILGSGAVGGYFGAQLARAHQRVTFLARGPHLRAIRERGLLVWSPLGDFVVQAPAEEDPAKVGVVDVVILAVKTYDNDQAIRMLSPLLGDASIVLTLQNGVESVDQVAEVLGPERVLGGSSYIAAALTVPGLIEQTGTHRKIVFGEVFGAQATVSERVRRIHDAMAGAEIEVEAVPDARVSQWEKLVYLSPFAGFTGAARLPVGALWSVPAIRDQIMAAMAEVAAVARAQGVGLAPDLEDRIHAFTAALPASTRSSLLIDLLKGKRIEVEALLGAVVRKGLAVGVPTPITSTLYSLLKPYESGTQTT